MPWYDDLGNACSYKVNLRLNSIATPTVAELNMLKGAQLVYGQYGICISFVLGQSLLLSKKQRGKLETVYGSCEFEKVTSDDQKLLHSLDDNYASSPFDIRVYFVSKIYDPDLCRSKNILLWPKTSSLYGKFIMKRHLRRFFQT